ncbi:MAG: hypothetical protein OWT28_11870 [Firmicutes bacterium]|nr:hypothetical protein [Bacillota bacterium]
MQYGLAGADREHDFQIIRPALATLPVSHWDVVCDTLEKLRTGCPYNVGVVLVCGSGTNGTNAMGRNRAGRTIKVGGFGYMFGDFAGGHFLATETFRAAIRSMELRDIPFSLPERVAKALGFSTRRHYWSKQKVPPPILVGEMARTISTWLVPFDFRGQ